MCALRALSSQRHYNQLKDELLKMRAPEGAPGDEDEDDPKDVSHNVSAENMDTGLPASRPDSEADVSKKSPDGATSSEKLGESSSGSQPSKDASPSGAPPIMLLNHMQNLDTVGNYGELMGPTLMNAMFDSSGEIEGELQMYHL